MRSKCLLGHVIYISADYGDVLAEIFGDYFDVVLVMLDFMLCYVNNGAIVHILNLVYGGV